MFRWNSIGTTFKNNTAITSFDELVNFTGLTLLSNGTFEGCSSLMSVAFPNGVTSLPEGVCRNCTSLTSVTLPSAVTYIGDQAFLNAKVTGTVFPQTLQNIRNYSFYGCKFVTVDLPATMTNIGISSFQSNTQLTTVTVRATTPPTLGSAAFTGCSALTTIYVPSASVSAYKAASQWSNHASKIQAIP